LKAAGTVTIEIPGLPGNGNGVVLKFVKPKIAKIKYEIRKPDTSGKTSWTSDE
jgi:hypothetical protein